MGFSAWLQKIKRFANRLTLCSEERGMLRTLTAGWESEVTFSKEIITIN